MRFILIPRCFVPLKLKKVKQYIIWFAQDEGIISRNIGMDYNFKNILSMYDVFYKKSDLFLIRYPMLIKY